MNLTRNQAHLARRPAPVSRGRRRAPAAYRQASILRWWLISLIAGVALAACGRAAQEATPTAPDPQAVLTAAAQTAEAGLTQAALTTVPTLTPEPTSTPAPTQPPAAQAPATPTAAATLTPGPPGADIAVFLADVTVPDGTGYQAGASFTKTWRLQNGGTSTWTTDYDLVFIGGEQMGGADAVALPRQVGPGETVEVSIDLIAPNTSGPQRGDWILRNAAGQTFQTSFYVLISVDGGAAGTPVAGDTPTPSGTGPVSSAAIQVDNAAVTGACPHSFTFSAQVNMASAAQVTVQLEAGADDPTYTFNLPAGQTYNLGAGTANFSYSLSLSDSVSGWARLRVDGPNRVTSNQVNFQLTCE